MDFPINAFAGFQLGHTTPEMARQAMGSAPLAWIQMSVTVMPDAASPIARSANLVTWTYGYAPKPMPVSGIERCFARKSAALTFNQGHLVFYGFASDLPGEQNKMFALAKLHEIKPGVTTRADVLGLLGQPNELGQTSVQRLGEPPDMAYFFTQPDVVPARNRARIIRREVIIKFSRAELVHDAPLLRDRATIYEGIRLCNAPVPHL